MLWTHTAILNGTCKAYCWLIKNNERSHNALNSFVLWECVPKLSVCSLEVLNIPALPKRCASGHQLFVTSQRAVMPPPPLPHLHNQLSFVLFKTSGSYNKHQAIRMLEPSAFAGGCKQRANRPCPPDPNRVCFCRNARWNDVKDNIWRLSASMGPLIKANSSFLLPSHFVQDVIFPACRMFFSARPRQASK